MKIVTLQITIDGLILGDNKSIDEWIDELNINSIHPPILDVLGEEYQESE